MVSSASIGVHTSNHIATDDLWLLMLLWRLFWICQVDDADVQAFSTKLLQELSGLVEVAAAAQEADEEGLCQLCDREMPLTKHHLIPR